MTALLKVNDLRTYFYTRSGIVKAVDGVGFSVEKGRTLGIVGESGSGKSVTMMSLMGLIPKPPGKIVSGSAIFDGEDLLHMSEKRLRSVRGDRIAMIFQDPMTSLNPYLKISQQLTEVLTEHRSISHKEARSKAIEMLEKVGIPDASKRIDHYPHQFSGGMRQRVMIAMALIAKPDLLIADEPTTALDVTIQAQILELLKDMQKELGMAIILITHDLGVVASVADEALVMYAGKPMESGLVEDIFYRNAHPYTEGLLSSMPSLESSKKELFSIPGLPPDPSKLPAGCVFSPRCHKSKPICRTDSKIPLRQIGKAHLSVCHLEAQHG